MAYMPKELRLLSSNISPQAMQIWELDSKDLAAAITANGYINDAHKVGIRVGDLVYVRSWSGVAAVIENAATGYLEGRVPYSGTMNAQTFVATAPAGIALYRVTAVNTPNAAASGCVLATLAAIP